MAKSDFPSRYSRQRLPTHSKAYKNSKHGRANCAINSRKGLRNRHTCRQNETKVGRRTNQNSHPKRITNCKKEAIPCVKIEAKNDFVYSCGSFPDTYRANQTLWWAILGQRPAYRQAKISDGDNNDRSTQISIATSIVHFAKSRKACQFVRLEEKSLLWNNEKRFQVISDDFAVAVVMVALEDDYVPTFARKALLIRAFGKSYWDALNWADAAKSPIHTSPEEMAILLRGEDFEIYTRNALLTGDYHYGSDVDYFIRLSLSSIF